MAKSALRALASKSLCTLVWSASYTYDLFVVGVLSKRKCHVPNPNFSEAVAQSYPDLAGKDQTE